MALGIGRAGCQGGVAAHLAMPDSCLPRCRIARATEALQTFRPAASSSFRHCQLDVGREMKLLTELSFLRGKELASVQPEPSSLSPNPCSGPGGQCPPGTSWPPAWPGQPLPPSQPRHTTLSYRAQRCFSLSLCRLWPPRTLLRSTPGKSAALPWGPCHPLGPSLFLSLCSHTAWPPTYRFLLFLMYPEFLVLPPPFLRLLHNPGPSDLSLS